tara:strand:- start:254 stop:547 length:294 start_codon:yes stop_codon:yes gene_type:complete
MEALLYTGFGISLFCLGLATGAILENRLIRAKSALQEERVEIANEVKKIEPMLISLADQIERDYNNYTPVMYELQDPDITLEIPAVREQAWLKKQKN